MSELEDNGRLLKSEMGHLRADLNRVLVELVARDRVRDEANSAMQKELHEVQIRCALRTSAIEQAGKNTTAISSLKEDVAGLRVFSRNWNISNSLAAAGAYIVSIINGN